jgi:membrane protease subunit HflK
VQAAFEDTLKAGQDGDRAKKEGLAYASDVIPKAQGSSARLREEAEGYKSRVIAQAEGDAQRFNRVYAEYQKAPTVTRDRLYIDAMQQIYANVSKVMVESRGNSNLLYLPLDKLIQQSAAVTLPGSAGSVSGSEPPTSSSVDVRSRDGQRSRERDSR